MLLPFCAHLTDNQCRYFDDSPLPFFTFFTHGQITTSGGRSRRCCNGAMKKRDEIWGLGNSVQLLGFCAPGAAINEYNKAHLYTAQKGSNIVTNDNETTVFERMRIRWFGFNTLRFLKTSKLPARIYDLDPICQWKFYKWSEQGAIFQPITGRLLWL